MFILLIKLLLNIILLSINNSKLLFIKFDVLIKLSFIFSVVFFKKFNSFDDISFIYSLKESEFKFILFKLKLPDVFIKSPSICKFPLNIFVVVIL